MPIIKNVPICVVRKCQAPPKNESIWCGLSFVVLNKEMRKLMFATRLASNQILLFPWEKGFCQTCFISVWHQLSDVCAWGWNSACVRRFSALCVCENNSVHYKFEITVIPVIQFVLRRVWKIVKTRQCTLCRDDVTVCRINSFSSRQLAAAWTVADIGFCIAGAIQAGANILGVRGILTLCYTYVGWCWWAKLFFRWGTATSLLGTIFFSF